jgi:hypothetical protein
LADFLEGTLKKQNETADERRSDQEQKTNGQDSQDLHDCLKQGSNPVNLVNPVYCFFGFQIYVGVYGR